MVTISPPDSPPITVSAATTKATGVRPRRAAIVGAGPVGALLATHLAQRGWTVDVYEFRSDLRLNPDIAGGRSINLALSVRGIEALRGSGSEELVDRVLENAVPMHGRMIHQSNGELASQAYSVYHEHINSVDRASLNIAIIEQADSYPDVTFHFNRRLTRCDMDRGMLEFEVVGATGQSSAPEACKATADFIIGCDGAYSRVRSYLQRKVEYVAPALDPLGLTLIRMDYAQSYIPHRYCELSIPPALSKDGRDTYAMDPNHLHIWPRHTFMLIALPNADKSFTCTLFMPKENFDAIRKPADLDRFFAAYFPDAVALIGRERLHEEYFRNPKGSLVSIKCSPYHHKDKGLILGDAAHAMVPFFGQGLNCGFQDVTTLCRFLDTHAHLDAALEAYSHERAPDAASICDLAMYNYIDMRSGTINPLTKARKAIEGWLYKCGIGGVIPMYSMVAFSTMRYSMVKRKWERQGRWMMLGLATVAVGAAVGLYAGWSTWRSRDTRRWAIGVARGRIDSVSPQHYTVTIEMPRGTGRDIVDGMFAGITDMASGLWRVTNDAVGYVYRSETVKGASKEAVTTATEVVRVAGQTVRVGVQEVARVGGEAAQVSGKLAKDAAQSETVKGGIETIKRWFGL